MFEIADIIGGVGLAAVFLCIYWYFTRSSSDGNEKKDPPLSPMAKRDFTLEELKDFDGKKQGRRILMGICGHVYDVSMRADFYGPEGPYGIFAGRDASRGLATMSLSADALKDEHDDLSDLNAMEKDTLNDWENQFKVRYPTVGKVLKPGEEHTNYNISNEESSNEASGRTKND